MKLKPRLLKELSREETRGLMARSMEDVSAEYDYVRGLLADVRKRGDAALLDAHRNMKADVTEADLEVSGEEIARAYDHIDGTVVDALRTAAANILRFHEAQREREMWSIEVAEGILAGRMTRPIDRVGCYIPGGRAVYPSTILMTVLPAKAAGVEDIIATTPPGPDMVVPPATLVAADIAGCDRVFKIGGPWGIGALAYGTATVPRVDKIVGPGNRYVTAAKLLVYGRVDIDSPAGPSEALILADETGDPELIAMDLLSQLEHDPDSAAVLISVSRGLAEEVSRVIHREFPSLPRQEILEASLSKHAHLLVADDMKEAVAFANDYAAEHLQIMTKDPFITLTRIKHAGSIFLGPNAPVPVGDYASGTNHVLPTGQCARMFSGLSVDDFQKKPTFQYLSRKGLAKLKDVVVCLAEEEGLPVHAMAVKARFKKS